MVKQRWQCQQQQQQQQMVVSTTAEVWSTLPEMKVVSTHSPSKDAKKREEVICPSARWH